MFNIIPISILITAIGGMVYIASGHLSELNGDIGEDEKFNFHLKARLADWVNQLPLGSVKIQSLSLTKKTLHRLRLFLLKSDNFLMKLIEKISRHQNSMNGSGEASGNNLDFWDDFTEKQTEEKIIAGMTEPEVKIDLAVKSDPAKKFFDITPSKILENKSIKKTLKIKKSSK